jgi:hypothetical protein
VICSAPGAAVDTSNHASAVSSVAVTIAVRHRRGSRRMTSTPVMMNESASRVSSPTQAIRQCAAVVVAGRVAASTNSQGTSATPAPISPGPSRLRGDAARGAVSDGPLVRVFRAGPAVVRDMIHSIATGGVTVSHLDFRLQGGTGFTSDRAPASWPRATCPD